MSAPATEIGNKHALSILIAASASRFWPHWRYLAGQAPWTWRPQLARERQQAGKTGQMHIKGRLVAIRLDQALVERGLLESRERAKRAIMAGQVLVNERIASKASELIKDQDRLV